MNATLISRLAQTLAGQAQSDKSGWEALVDYGAKVVDKLAEPVPSPVACSQEEAPLPPDVIALSKSEIAAIMSTKSSDLDECSLHEVTHSTAFENIENFWGKVAEYIVNVKYSASRRDADPQVVEALANLAPNQKEAVINHLARELGQATSGRYLFDTLSAAQQEEYRGYCQRENFIFATDYPQPISLNVSKQSLIKIAQCVSIPPETDEGAVNPDRPAECKTIAEYKTPGTVTRDTIIADFSRLDEIAAARCGSDRRMEFPAHARQSSCGRSHPRSREIRALAVAPCRR